MDTLNYLVIIECATDQDMETARRLVETHTDTPAAIFLKRMDGKLEASCVGLPPSVEESMTASPLDTVDETYARLKASGGVDHERIAQLKLVYAQVLDDSLTRLIAAHEEAGNPHSAADFYPMFTDANFHFFKLDRNGTPLKRQAPETVGPQTKDILPMLLDNCDKHFPNPRIINLDLTRKCNKRCEKCMYHAYGQPLENASDEMDIELAKKVLDEAATFQIKPTIHTNISGEPFLYEKLEEFLAYAQKLGLSVSTTTNGALLTEDKSELLLKYDVSTVAVSIDSMNDELYRRLQGPGGIATVVRNVERFLEMRGDRTKPMVQTTLVLDHSNAPEFEDYLEFWIQRVDSVTRTIRLDNADTIRNLYPLFFEEKNPLPCPLTWVSLKVWPDGKVAIPCPYNMEGSPDLDVSKMSIIDVWRSDEFRRWRKLMTEPQNPEVREFCKQCAKSPFVFRRRETDKYNIMYSHETETYTLKQGK